MTHDAPTDHLTRFLIEQAGVRGVTVTPFDVREF